VRPLASSSRQWYGLLRPSFNPDVALAKVLSEPDWKRLRIIDQRHPSSLAESEAMTGRTSSNLSRRPKTMSQCGSVELVPGKRGSVTPKVLVHEIQMDISIVAWVNLRYTPVQPHSQHFKQNWR